MKEKLPIAFLPCRRPVGLYLLLSVIAWVIGIIIVGGHYL